MAITDVHTDITGRDGTVHYVTYALPFKDAYKLGLQLAGVLSPVLGGAAGSLFGVESIDDELDLGAATKALGDIPQKLLELGDDELIKRVFARTRRVVQVDGKDIPQKLYTDEGLTEAYAGGNYVEMFKALWWVLGVNYAPFGMDAPGALSALWAKLQGMLMTDSLMGSSPTTETKSSNGSGLVVSA